MMKERLARAFAVIALGMTLLIAPSAARAASAATPTSAAATAADEAANEARPARGSVTASARERRYAAREAASPRTADFKGNGAGIYIGGSTLAIVLVVVLLVVLL